MATRRKKSADLTIPWNVVIGICVALALIALISAMYSRFAVGKELHLGVQAAHAYSQAKSLAVGGDLEAALGVLDQAFNDTSGSSAEETMYQKAKLAIYKADLMLTYDTNVEEGFKILGTIYANDTNNNARAEALMLASAHAVQGLDEGRLSVAEVRDYLLLDQNFGGVFGVTLAGAKLLDQPEETYEYLTRGFLAAANLTTSQKVYVLARSYSARLISPFIVPPPTDGYYHEFIASLEGIESSTDSAAKDNASISYQEFIGASYYNLARAYEMLPPGDVDITSSMSRMRSKLEAYISEHKDTAYGASAYLIGIDTRLICKTLSEAGFDAANLEPSQLKPYLDEIYSSAGWVVPCQEAFEVVARDIDPRFAEYF